MSALLAAVALGAALACHAHMLWRMRRGHGGGCLPSRRPVDGLRERQAKLAADLAQLSDRRG